MGIKKLWSVKPRMVTFVKQKQIPGVTFRRTAAPDATLTPSDGLSEAPHPLCVTYCCAQTGTEAASELTQVRHFHLTHLAARSAAVGAVLMSREVKVRLSPDFENIKILKRYTIISFQFGFHSCFCALLWPFVSLHLNFSYCNGLFLVQHFSIFILCLL